MQTSSYRGVDALAPTKHFLIRCQQRGIRQQDLDFVCQFGTSYFAPGGGVIYYLGSNGRRLARRRFGLKLDHLKNTVLVFSSFGCCMTAYRRSRPQRNWRAA